MDQDILTSVEKEMGILSEKVDNLDKKIDAHNTKHEADMARVLPIIEAFEASERRIDDAKAAGKAIGYIAAFLTSLGVAWLTAKQIWPWI